MRDAGCEVRFDLTQLAVMWVGEVLWNLRKFFALADEAERFFREEKPDAVVLIDYPGFNWHLAKRAKKYGIPVYYYSPPQVWGWKQRRVEKLRRYTDLVFSGLPFERDWLQEKGCAVAYVGHPFFDETHKCDTAISPTVEVALLPGSRNREVLSHLPVFLKVVRHLRARRAGITFAIGAYQEKQAEEIRAFLEEQKETEIPVYVGRTPEVIRGAKCCLAVSGSVSLELLYHHRPTVIVYQVPCYAWWIQWFFRCVKYITLVNLLVAKNPFRNYNGEYVPDSEASKEVLFPEYLTYRDRSLWMANDLARWLEDDAAYRACVERLRQLGETFCQPGAAARAAEIILKRR